MAVPGHDVPPFRLARSLCPVLGDAPMARPRSAPEISGCRARTPRARFSMSGRDAPRWRVLAASQAEYRGDLCHGSILHSPTGAAAGQAQEDSPKLLVGHL
jgi:hypothetical protein